MSYNVKFRENAEMKVAIALQSHLNKIRKGFLGISTLFSGFLFTAKNKDRPYEQLT